MNATLRLPGSLAEVAASPEGPEVGAFFDFDGTLMAGFSASHLSRARFKRRDVGLEELVRTVGVAVSAGVGRAGFEDLLQIGARAWRGRAHADLEAMGERLFTEAIADLVFPEARALVQAHHDRGHTVVLASSATEYQVEPVARFLGVDHVLCNRYTKDDGVLTGDVERPVIWGPTKATAVQRFAADAGIDLTRAYFYADGDEDVALMHLVGHPRPTNPRRRLAKAAQDRGWPTLRFSSRSSRRLGARARQVAGLAALVPAAAAGAGVGLVRRDRRAALNVARPRWLTSLLGIHGIELHVVGREHLEAARPAVFVYNHRNHVDPFIAATLVARAFTAVAPKEVAADRVVSTFGRLGDVIFDDADAPEVVDAIATKGLSVVVSAEGAAVDTTTVGPLDPAPLRLAVRAGVPVVPIVVRNSELVAGRTAATAVPGVVDVAVLAPIAVDGWTEATLDDHVAEVRQRFLDALADWPPPA